MWGFQRPDAAGWERLLSGVSAVGAGTVLGVARWLTPDAAGFGTHRQLGLGACTFLVLTGLPCPMCGATTTFALMADLRPLDAVLNQPFAAALAVATGFVFAVSAAEVVLPRRRWTRIAIAIGDREIQVAAAFLVLMGLAWVWKVYTVGAPAP